MEVSQVIAALRQARESIAAAEDELVSYQRERDAQELADAFYEAWLESIDG